MLDILNGSKTYLAAAGMFGLALYQALVAKDFPAAYQSFLMALGAVGFRHALTKSVLASGEAANEAVLKATRAFGRPMAVREEVPLAPVAEEPREGHPFPMIHDA